MADTKISNLTALAEAPTNGDFIALVDTSASATKKLDTKYLVRDSAGSGAIVTGAYTLTLPATGTAALLATANTFTAAQTLASSTQFTPQLILNNSGGVVGEGKGGIYFQSGGVGKWTIYHAPNDYFQILDAGTRSIEIRPTTRHVLLNTATDSGQLSIVTDATTSIGLVVNTPVSPTANIAEFRNNGTAVVSVGPNGSIAIKDGMTAPSAATGFAQLYVDTSDGDLKVIFGDGTIKTLATDTP